MSAPTHPVMRYHGGKWRLAPWIIGFFPEHRIYVEPFGGGASVLMRKPRSYAEVYNDLDDDVVNVFRVLRDPDSAAQLCEACRLTPWSRTEFWATYGEPSPDPVERARQTIFRSYAAHGSTHRTAHRTGFAARAFRQRSTRPDQWRRWPEGIAAYVERLRGVVIENRLAAEVIAQQDTSQTLFYLDPPYPVSTRTSIRSRSESDGGRAYANNLTDEDHRDLARLAHAVAGMVVVSGYACELYDRELYAGWERHTKKTRADKGERTEVLWLNPACSAARGREIAQHTLAV